MKKLLSLLSILALSIQCSKDTSETPKPPKPEPPVSTAIKPTTFTASNDDCANLKLKDLSDLMVGFAYGNGGKFQPQKNQRVDGSKNEQNITDNCKSITASMFYAGYLWKQIGNTTTYVPLDLTTKTPEFDFTYADREVDFALAKGLRIFGHCLFYPLLNNGVESDFTTPRPLLDYVDITKNPTVTNDDIKKVMENYLTVVLERYKDKVNGFDLINEFLGYGSDAGNVQQTWLRKRFPSGAAGDEEMFKFAGDLFVFAKSKAPKLTFFYN